MMMEFTEVLKFEKENSFKALITDRFSYWEKELVRALLYSALYCWVFTFYVLIRQSSLEFPEYLPVSMILFAASLWKMRRFQAQVFQRQYPKFYINESKWNSDIFNKFRYNRLLGYIRKKGWNTEQVQILKPGIKEQVEKIRTGSLMKSALLSSVVQAVIGYLLTAALALNSRNSVATIVLGLILLALAFFSCYLILLELEESRIQYSDLKMLEELDEKLEDFMLRKKV